MSTSIVKLWPLLLLTSSSHESIPSILGLGFLILTYLWTSTLKYLTHTIVSSNSLWGFRHPPRQPCTTSNHFHFTFLFEWIILTTSSWHLFIWDSWAWSWNFSWALRILLLWEEHLLLFILKFSVSVFSGFVSGLYKRLFEGVLPGWDILGSFIILRDVVFTSISRAVTAMHELFLLLCVKWVTYLLDGCLVFETAIYRLFFSHVC